jgi:hypothetical protein
LKFELNPSIQQLILLFLLRQPKFCISSFPSVERKAFALDAGMVLGQVTLPFFGLQRFNV